MSTEPYVILLRLFDLIREIFGFVSLGAFIYQGLVFSIRQGAWVAELGVGVCSQAYLN